MTQFYRSSNKTNAQIFEVRGNNDARFYLEVDAGRIIWASVGSQYSGTWQLGCGNMRSLGDLRRMFWRLHRRTNQRAA